MKINKELIKGSTDMLILNLLKNEDMYGYHMIKKLKEKKYRDICQSYIIGKIRECI